MRPCPRWRAGIRLVDGALALLVRAGAGLVAVLAIQSLITAVALSENLSDAVYYSTRVLATVADAPGADAAPGWFKVVATLDTIAAVGLLAVFTAALIRLVSGQRLTVTFGRRSAPRRHHVLVIGFGQIGLRVCQELRRRGVPVLALEQTRHAPAVRLAPGAGLPVAIGRGDDRRVLEAVGIRRCVAVAALTSDDLTNVEVGLAVKAVAPETALLLRVGDNNVAGETGSLLHLGRICDIHDITAHRIVKEMRT